jgi:hypothetical protein
LEEVKLESGSESEIRKNKARTAYPDDPDIMENLAVSFIGLGEFHKARQCLQILKKMDPTHLEVSEKRERYVNLKVARQFSVDVAASTYQRADKGIETRHRCKYNRGPFFRREV